MSESFVEEDIKKNKELRNEIFRIRKNRILRLEFIAEREEDIRRRILKVQEKIAKLMKTFSNITTKIDLEVSKLQLEALKAEMTAIKAETKPLQESRHLIKYTFVIEAKLAEELAKLETGK